MGVLGTYRLWRVAVALPPWRRWAGASCDILQFEPADRPAAVFVLLMRVLLALLTDSVPAVEGWGGRATRGV